MKKDHGTIPWQGYNISYAGITDIGQKRQNNEDDFLILPEAALFCVADGAGGHESGVLASHLTLSNISAVFSRDFGSPDITLPLNISEFSISKPLLISAIEFANLKVFQTSSSHNMASTIVGCHFLDDSIHVCHVGDSRAYIIRNGSMSQITEDHSLVYELFKSGNIKESEIRTHPRRNIITRAIGPAEKVKVSHRAVLARHNDTYLLCSDGLTSMLNDDTILSILQDNDRSLIHVAEQLVEEANNNGGKDNITVILVKLYSTESGNTVAL